MWIPDLPTAALKRRARGAEVVDLDLSIPFTAARERNAGLARLAKDSPDFVQFLDGDCILRDEWIKRAKQFLHDNLRAAVVCGRRRERFPDASIYNAMADAEWNTPVGEAKACGGDAMTRYQAVAAVKGYREDLIAGEEPELCLRLRAKGWTVWRIEAEMTWHDADMHRFSQWWTRTERAGHAFAEGAARFSTTQNPHWDRETRRIWVWGIGLPAVILLASALHPAFVALALIYPAQILRLSRRMDLKPAFFNVIGKFAEAKGALRFYLRQWRGGPKTLIEYK